MAKYLDESGLQYLMTKIKEKYIGTGEVLDLEADLASPKKAQAAYERLVAALELNKPVFVRYVDSYIMPATAYHDIDNNALNITYQLMGTADQMMLTINSDGTFDGRELNIIDENNLAHEGNIGMVYDSAERKFYATVNNQKAGAGVDASAFIKDGMLDDVEVIAVTESNLAEIQEAVSGAAVGDKVIKFAWNTDGGGKVDYIKTTDIAVDPETAATQVSEDIIIAGGPLADELSGAFSGYKDADGNTVIPKDMTLQELLTLLVCKVMWPTSIVTTGASLVSTVEAPAITMSTSAVEVGTSVAYSVKNGKSGYTATPAKASGFTYGYSAENDDTKDSSDTSVQGKVSSVSVESANTTLDVTSTGNEAQSATGTDAAGSAVISGTIVAIEGSNTVTGQNTSATYRGIFNGLEVYYGCSNTGKTNNNGVSYPSQEKPNVILTSTQVTSTQATKSFTAAYKYFLGYSDKTSYDQFDSASVRALTAKTGNITKDGTTTVVGTTAVASDGRSIVVAVPSKYKLSAITNGLGADILANFSSVGTVKVKVGGGTGAEVDYKVYVYPITNGAVVEFKGVTVKKA